MKKSNIIPTGFKYDFWKENKLDKNFELNSNHLKERFLDFLKKQKVEWIEYYDSDMIIRVFITSKDGLSSVHKEEQFEYMYAELKPEIAKYEKSLSELK